jgi:uncharacterized damage-inducible protein DinB
MKKIEWFERQFVTGQPSGMLPFFIDRLEGTIVRLRDKIFNVSDHLLAQNLDGKWSIKQNIGHLADLDVIAIKRIDEINNGVSPMMSAVIPPQQDYNTLVVEEILKYFSKNRREAISTLLKLDELSLAKSSLHPRLKILMTPVDLAMFHAEHDDHHLVRIGEILKALPR